MTILRKVLSCGCAGALLAVAVRYVGAPDAGTQFSEFMLAVQVVRSGEFVNRSPALSMTLGGADELPFGPLSFDLDGMDGFVVADPLAFRAVSVASTGQVKEVWPIGFSVDRVRWLDQNSVLVRDAVSRDAYVVQRDKPVQRLDSPFPDDPPYPRSGQEHERRLLGLWSLSINPPCVVAEFEGSKQDIRIRRTVRYLNSSGRQVHALDQFESDQFLPMEDDIRVRGARVAQLVSGPGTLRIRSWRMPLD